MTTTASPSFRSIRPPRGSGGSLIDRPDSVINPFQAKAVIAATWAVSTDYLIKPSL